MTKEGQAKSWDLHTWIGWEESPPELKCWGAMKIIPHQQSTMETPRASWQEKVTGKFRNIVWCGWGAQDGVRKGQGKARLSKIVAECMDSPSRRDTKGQGRMWKTMRSCCLLYHVLILLIFYLFLHLHTVDPMNPLASWGFCTDFLFQKPILSKHEPVTRSVWIVFIT